MSALEGRRALVTGAGVGIGQGIALELARQGAAVAVHYYADSVAGGQETVAAIEESGGIAIPIEADLTTWRRAAARWMRQRRASAVSTC